MNTLVVASIEEKILYIHEIRGQLSDGNWENTRPHEHWRPWCDVSWQSCVVDPKNVGPEFFAPKDNYRLTDLIQYIGDRMLFYLNLYAWSPDTILAYLDDGVGSLPDTIYYWKLYQQKALAGDAWYAKAVSSWEQYGITQELVEKATNSPVYTEKDLRKILQGLSKSMKGIIHRPHEAAAKPAVNVVTPADYDVADYDESPTPDLGFGVVQVTNKIFPLAVAQQLREDAKQFAADYVKTYPEAAESQVAIARSHYAHLVSEFRKELLEQANNALREAF